MLGQNRSSLPSRRKSYASAVALAPSPDRALFLLRALLLLALLLLLSLQTVFVGVASAHSSLISSEPANGSLLEESPERVLATFSEELDSGNSIIRVFDEEGTQVDNGDGGVDLDDLDHLSMVVTLPSLPAGAYTVRWQALSADDGDDSEGAFTFTIAGNAAEGAAVQADNGGSYLAAGVVGVVILFLAAFAVFYVWRR